MVTHQLQVRCRPVKVRRSETDVLPLSHPTNQPTNQLKNYKEHCGLRRPSYSTTSACLLFNLIYLFSCRLTRVTNTSGFGSRHLTSVVGRCLLLFVGLRRLRYCFELNSERPRKHMVCLWNWDSICIKIRIWATTISGSVAAGFSV